MSVGSDFECFMFDRRTQEFIPEVMLGLPDKQEEHIPLTLGDEVVGSIHRDNVSVEMCSLVTNPDNFASSVAKVMESAKQFVIDKLGDHVCFMPVTSVGLPEELANHPNANELGCDIDYIPSSQAGRSVARHPLDAGMMQGRRYSGGHVHISYDAWERIPAWVAALMCDLFIGFPHITYLDTERAKFYGNAGLHRATTYPNGKHGVEYRPLDSGWVHLDETRFAVQEGTKLVHDLLTLGENDPVMELMRIRAQAPEHCMFVDVSTDQALSMHEEALAVAKRYLGEG
jgi:hypothetical protein